VSIDVIEMWEWEKFAKKIEHLQSDLARFKVDFLDRDSFKSFCDNLRSEVEGYHKIYITGYFSETIRETLQKLISPSKNVRLICPACMQSC